LHDPVRRRDKAGVIVDPGGDVDNILEAIKSDNGFEG
jgi:hypothetical protein